MTLLCSFWDLAVIVASCKGTQYLDALITPATFDLPHPYLYTVASIALWSLYGFWAGLFGTGIWVIGHECGHQAFSESKAVNNTVGWFLHSACVFLLCSVGWLETDFSSVSVCRTTRGASPMRSITPRRGT